MKIPIQRRIDDLCDRVFGRKYRIIGSIDEQFNKKDISPDILFLGDSTVLRAANEDMDRRTTCQMLSGDLEDKASVVELSHGAYHMEIFFHILNTLKVTRHCPKLIILPINMRSFSPQWHMRPDWQFKEEIELLTRYYSGHGLKRYYRRPKNINGYEETSVEYPLSRLKTIREFEDIRLNRNSKYISESERRKELFIYFSLFQIPQDNPRLLKIKDVIRLVRNLGSKVIFYITPINIQAALRSVGSEFSDYFSRNIETVKNLIVKEGGCFLNNKELGEISNDSVVCIDYSRSLDSGYFFHSESIDEHLNQKGREFIAKNNMEIAIKMLR